jgi:hypothetical protein
MTRDGNAALNIFKMALSVAMMRLKYNGIFPDPSYESEDYGDGDEDEKVCSDDEMDLESEKVLEKHDVDDWAEGMKEKGERKRDAEGDGRHVRTWTIAKE